MKKSFAALLFVLTLALTGCSNETPATDRSSIADTSVEEPCPGAIDWTEAASAEGQNVVVQGQVMSARYESGITGEPTFLNVGADYPDPSRFTVVIWGQDRGNFDEAPEVAYDSETLCVSGDVTNYQGVPQMAVSDPSQVTIVP